jgi:hypothetical protein
MTIGEQKKSWYSARLVFRCDIGNQPVPSDIFEESIRLVRAADEAEASERAAAIGRINERDEQSSVGEMVRWRFVGVVEVQDLLLPEIADGCEVFSRLSRTEPEIDPEA